MFLETLKVCDFRVFGGEHTLELSPQIKWEKKRPIILFGGLNGAGKTSILTAVRLALYGRQSLGPGTSQKAYEKYLADSIHHSKNSQLQPKQASIELAFTHSNMGITKHYRVLRRWVRVDKKINESLIIFEDDKEMRQLSYEHCQSILNELIPVGVSELFFFDGEKISDMAEDSSGMVLSDAIKKLLGLDLIERLKADLTVLHRNQDKSISDKKIRDQINILEEELSDVESKVDAELSEYQYKRESWIEAKAKLDRLTNELNEKGGAWAASKEDQLTRSAELTVEKKNIEELIREQLADKYPFHLVSELIASTKKQLNLEKKIKLHHASLDSVSTYTTSILKEIKKKIDDKNYKTVDHTIKQKFNKMITDTPKGRLIHDVTESNHNAIINILEESTTTGAEKVNLLREQLSNINQELDDLGRNIASAPDESTLTETFNTVKTSQESVNKKHAKMMAHKELAKQNLKVAIGITNKLSALHEKISASEDKKYSYKHLSSAIPFLTDFSGCIAKQKIQDLEKEFSKTFKGLARKEDMCIHASIDHKTFKVTLFDDNNQTITKDELSKGECQIYAISILAALAKTSGRNLPIIIDTPLARLDSKHRKNLIENYFPYASQQVIILSTDTEVDEEFYQGLYKHMSHAYMLEYNTESGSSAAEKGYFWRTTEAA